jgi:soluble lytic murein transglycosylase-like protein
MGLFLAFLLVLGVGFLIIKPSNYASIAYPPIPNSHYRYIEDAIAHCKIPPHKRGFVAAVAYAESTFRAEAASGAGAVGVMQLLRPTGKGVADKYQIGGLNANTFTDPAISYKLGTCYLHYLMEEVVGSEDPAAWDNERNLTAILIAYNAGPARGKSYLRGSYSGPTSSVGYAAKIIRASQVYSLDIAKHDQEAATEGSSIDALTEVREIIWNVFLPR